MKLTQISVFVGALLSGCNALDLSNSEQVTLNPSLSLEQNDSASLQSSMSFQNDFKNRIKHSSMNAKVQQLHQQEEVEKQKDDNAISGAKLNINHFAKGLMQDMIANLQYVNSTTPLAVVSFVMLDSDYNQFNLLGNQMAESLIHEIHKFGIPVIDYKTTGFIRITENGDFAFSKDYEELGDTLAARYILGGTMTKHSEGYIINARIIGLKSKAVVASAQSFIPSYIANALSANIKPNSKYKSFDTSEGSPDMILDQNKSIALLN